MNEVDEIYYRHGANTSLAQKVVYHARKKMFKHLTNTVCIGKDTTILDFGVSEYITEESNFLEKHAKNLANITCAGIGDGSDVKEAFPDVSYVSLIPNAPLPFKDNEFDIAYSNAVFEHLDTDELRAFFFKELVRVSRTVYICVPNRWFPVEHHTAVPLVHFIPSLFRALLRRGEKKFWAKSENLAFLGKSDFKKIAGSTTIETAYTGIWLGPFSSNIAIWSKS